MTSKRCPRCGGGYRGEACYACAIRNGESIKPPTIGESDAHRRVAKSSSCTGGRRSGIIDRIRRLLSDGSEWTAHAVEKSLELEPAVVCTTLGLLVKTGEARRVKKDSKRRSQVWHYTLISAAQRRVLDRLKT